MTLYEIISISIASIAILFSLKAILEGRKNASAMVEIAINERITSTKDRVGDATNIMTPVLAKVEKSEDDKRMLELYGKQLNLAIENNLNSYEEACAKYLDRKVDRSRFKKLYKTEIRKLVESDSLKKYFDGVSSKYKAILKVYKQWENLED